MKKKAVSIVLQAANVMGSLDSGRLYIRVKTRYCKTCFEQPLIVEALCTQTHMTNNAVQKYNRNLLWKLSTILLSWISCHLTIRMLLFISSKFVKGLFAITLLLLVISSWNVHDVCQRFLYNQKQNFSWIRQKTKNFPIDGEISHFLARRTESRGSYCRTPGVRRRRCQRRRPHLIKVSL